MTSLDARLVTSLDARLLTSLDPRFVTSLDAGLVTCAHSQCGLSGSWYVVTVLCFVLENPSVVSLSLDVDARLPPRVTAADVGSAPPAAGALDGNV